MFHAWQVMKVFGPSVCWDLQHSSSTTEVPSFGHGSLAERIWEPHVWRMEEVAEHPTPMLLCKVLSVCFWLIHRCIFHGFLPQKSTSRCFWINFSRPHGGLRAA